MSRQKFGSIETILTKIQQPQRFSSLLCPRVRTQQTNAFSNCGIRIDGGLSGSVSSPSTGLSYW